MEFSLPKEMWELSLPKEMWFRIWSDLDFETLQKTCVLVCQGWFENIRGDGRLSSQLSLKNTYLEDEEAIAILSQWKELRILRLSKNLDQVDLSKTHKFLKKVIIPCVSEVYSNVSLDVLKDYPVLVNKVCFNPHDRLNSLGLDNITELTLHLGELEAIEESKKALVSMGVMKNLIRLTIIFGEGYDDFNFESTIEPLFQGLGFSFNLEEVRLKAKGDYIQICGDLILRYLSQITRLEIVGIDPDVAYLEDLSWIPNLKNLKTLVLYELEIHWNISVLESVLNALGSIKNLKIVNSLCVLGIPLGFDKLMFQSAMLEALEIIEEKFPFECTEIEIQADMTHIGTTVNYGYGLTIIKEKGKGPILKKLKL